MIGKIVKLINKTRFGFIKSTTGEEFYFKFENFKFKKDLEHLKLGDEVRFYESKTVNGKNRDALSIYKIIRVKDILNKYPIKLDNIIEIAKRVQLNNIINEHSYMSEEESQQIINTFYEDNNNKANKNNPNFKHQGKLKKKSVSTTIFEKLIRDNYLIFLDTSSLMNYNALKVLKNEVIPYLKKYKKQLYVVDLVFKEISRNEKSSHVPTAKQAKSARFVLDILAKDDLYAIPETNSVEEEIADQELISCFTNYRVKYNLCLITNDNSHKQGGKLAQGIINLKNDINVKHTKDILVYCINHNRENPRLIKYESDRDSNFSFHDHTPKRVKL